MSTPRKQKIPSDIKSFLAPYAPPVQAVALALRELVFSVAPDAIEQIDAPGKLLGYGFAQTYKDTICVIMPLKAAVNFGFPRGADLPDSRGLLAGTGKRARHVKIADVDQVDMQAVRALLEASIKQLRDTQ